MLKEAGLNRINHNLNSSRRFYPNICTTHTYDQRINNIRMLKRIGFYRKNGMNLSDTSCYFFENEYRIFYAGEEIEDKSQLDKITDTVYRDFFGDAFVDANVVFHWYVFIQGNIVFYGQISINWQEI